MKNKAAVWMGKRKAASLTPEARVELARKAASARWAGKTPEERAAMMSGVRVTGRLRSELRALKKKIAKAENNA